MEMDIRGFVAVAMIFCHIANDYYLQGILANLKQKSWWQEHYSDDFYKGDFIIALIMHAMSWSFMITLPIVLINWGGTINWDYYCICFFMNTIIHAVVDHLKANKKVINLTMDQLIHMGQIFMTLMIMCFNN